MDAFEQKLQEARDYADGLIARTAATWLEPSAVERQRAEKECYDLETIERLITLAARLMHYDHIEPKDAAALSRVTRLFYRRLSNLWRDESV